MTRGLLILLTLLALALGRHLAFDDDEFQHAHMSRLIGRGEVAHRDFFEHHLPLYHFLHAPSMAGADGPEDLLRLRAFSALGYGICLTLAAGILRRRTGWDQPAILLLTGLSPIFLFKMIEARPESLGLTLGMASLWLLSLQRPPLWTAGLLGAAMVLCSQKFIFPAAGLFLVCWTENGGRATLRFLLGSGLLPLLYLGYLLGTGSLAPAWRHLVVMNSGWKESFSPWMYGGLLWRTSGILCGLAGLGLLLGDAPSSQRRSAALLTGSGLLGVLLVPIPFRQTWLMVFPGLILSAGLGWNQLRDLLPPGPRRTAGLTVLALCGALPALAELHRETRSSLQADLEQMRAVAERTAGPVFDGRGLIFWRGHVGFYPWMHQGLIQMLDQEAYGHQTRAALEQAGLPPVIRDYRTDLFPENLRAFLNATYLPTEVEGLWQPGFRLDRSRLAGSGMILSLPSAGQWQFDWTGGRLLLNGEAVDPGSVHALPAGDIRVTARGFIRNAKIVRVDQAP